MENVVETNRTAKICDTEAMNSLLRGELSAIETYDQALEKFKGQVASLELIKIRDQHRNSATTLRSQIASFGGKPSEGSGAWGTFAHAVTGAAKILGPETALAALRQGEEHGVNDYQSALENMAIAEECRMLIKITLLPRCKEHVTALEKLSAIISAS
ncbi:DUF2383 domain-containing protein [Zavarzinella formosa]|uniref:DUF2383 domain-containing protein n=1 Tax=Zavarzinella formosa TaxID=360055 RepID=UPI0003015E09|nr:DUF2383 domain-containing protein [Zavarzinella formosa]